MSVKRSAFSVFLEKGKSASHADVSSSTEEDKAKLTSFKKKERLASCPSTPNAKEKIPKEKSKSEQRFDSIRKSIRRKSKSKHSHHEITLSKKGKENKLEKVVSTIGSKSNWAESLQSLNSSKLEEEFLPDIVEQKKQQLQLHGEASTSSLTTTKSRSKPEQSRKRSHSMAGDIEIKPPIPKKKGKSPQEKSIASSSTEEVDEKAVASADKLFAWIIAPVKVEQFFSDVWQKKPLFVKRRQPTYNNVWFSTKEFDKILRQQNVQFTKNLDIAVFRNGKRETLNPIGRAFAPMVWKFYEEGCSIRLLNPATFSSNVWHLCAKLQEYFGCLVGANVYLTPAGSQGFAPHYDDIEAFVIQLEGKKRWRLYPSRDINELLARNSSGNLSPEELGEPILDRVLEPGDALYFPRGTIHQAVTQDDCHSLHITLSVFQKCCWSDYMEKLVPMALQTAIEEDVEFRKALPIGFHNHIGMSNSEKTTDERKDFIKTVEQLMKKLLSYVSVDQAADELVLDQMEEFLPPSLTSTETDHTVYGSGAVWDEGHVQSSYEVTLDSKLRLLRPGIVRLAPEDETLLIHHTLGNSRQYKELALGAIEVPLQFADVVEYFLMSYPEYVRVKDAPIEDDEVKLDLAKRFYDAGILCFEHS